MSTLTVGSLSGPASSSYILDVAAGATLRSQNSRIRTLGLQDTGGTNMIAFDDGSDVITLEAKTAVTAAYSSPVNMNNSMSGNTITWNLNTGQNYYVNVPNSTTYTLGSPSNQHDGKSGIIMVRLNSSSNLNFAGSTFIFPEASAPSFSGNTLNMLAYYVQTNPADGNRRIVIVPTLNLG
jgi:hypothetical protein